MRLYSKKSEKLEIVPLKPFELEKDIQELVENNSDEFFNLEFIETEVTVGNYRIDSLCFDNETNSFVIIEYKKGTSYSVIDQGYTYLQLLLNNKSDFLLILSQHINKVLKSSDIDWNQSKILFISQSFNSYQKDSVNFKNLPFELWEIKRFANNTIVFDKHNPTSNESIESISSNKKGSIYSEISKEVKQYDEEFHTKKLNPKMLNIWEDVKSRLLGIEGIDTKVVKAYIKFEYKGWGLCYCGFRSNKLGFGIIRGNIKTDGSKSKNYFTLDDPKQIAREKSWTWKSGVVGTDYEITVDDNSDLDYIIFLVKQKIKNIDSRINN